MRFNIGQEIYVVAFSNVDKKYAMNYPLLFNNIQPTKIFIKKLTVEEHHKVSFPYDPLQAKIYDGFLLLDEEGNIWKNQYPFANYGQTTDNSNWEFSYDYSPNENVVDLVKNAYKFPIQFQSLEVVMERLARGIKDTGETELQILYDAVVIEFENIAPTKELKEVKHFTGDKDDPNNYGFFALEVVDKR